MMRKLGVSLGLMSLVLLLASCERAIHFEVGNPCDHPLFVATSFRSYANQAERDEAAQAGAELQWAVLPANGVADAGLLFDSAGVDHEHAVWVDAASFRTTATYEQAEDADGPIWLDEGACAQKSPPMLLALVVPGGGDDPSLIHVAGPEEIVRQVAGNIVSLESLDSDVQVGGDTMEAKVWPRESGDFGAVLAPLAGEQPGATLHTCDRFACVESNIGATLPMVPLEAGKRPPSALEDLISTILFVFVIVIVVKTAKRRWAKYRANARERAERGESARPHVRELLPDQRELSDHGDP
jgi:hypothetical protein